MTLDPQILAFAVVAAVVTVLPGADMALVARSVLVHGRRSACVLANAAQIAQVPGRKTDVKDCVWIAQLVEHGLVRGSFVPPGPIRELRDLTRYRAALIHEHTREANRLQKVLEDAGVKLASVASDILGVSGRAMLDALTRGTTDPDVLADLARGTLRRKLPALRQALVGRFRPHHAFLVSQVLAHLDYLDEVIETLSTHIDEVIGPFAEEVNRLDTIPGVNKRTPCFGELLHLDGSPHAWLARCPSGRRSSPCSTTPPNASSPPRPYAALALRLDRRRMFKKLL
jgi:transposase